MLGLSKKEFFIILGLSVGVWVITIPVQIFTGADIKYDLLSGNGCQLTGYPIAKCIYPNETSIPFWMWHALNVIVWFLVLNLLWRIFKKRKS